MLHYKDSNSKPGTACAACSISRLQSEQEKQNPQIRAREYLVVHTVCLHLQEAWCTSSTHSRPLVRRSDERLPLPVLRLWKKKLNSYSSNRLWHSCYCIHSDRLREGLDTLGCCTDQVEDPIFIQDSERGLLFAKGTKNNLFLDYSVNTKHT